MMRRRQGPRTARVTGRVRPHITGDDVAHLEVNGNEVVGSHLVPGLEMDVEQIENGIEAHIRVLEGVRLAKPVHLCFGMFPRMVCSTSS